MSDVQTTLRLNDQASSVLRSVSSAAKQTQSQLQQTGRAIDQAFKSTAPNSFANSASSAMSRVTSSAENLGNAIDDIFDDVDTGFGQDLASGFQSASRGAEEFKDSAEEAGDALKDVADNAEDLGESIDSIDGGGAGLDEVADDAENAGSAMNEASGQALNLEGALRKLFAAISVAAIANQVKQFVSDSIELGKNYTATMSEVAAISGATGAEYEMLEATARQYGATTIFSASEAAEALKYMSLAGWDANQSASALGGVLNLAAASGMELGQASDMVTDYLSAFGMQADQAGYFADMLSYAQSHSNTSAQQLGEAYLNSAANMHAAGQDIETTTSLLEAMANQGTKGARAGTQLAAIMRDITNGMEDGAIKIGETSVAVQDQYGNFRDLTDILTDVESAVDGMGSAERSAALAATFTADSTKGINQILTEGMENIAQYEEDLRGSAGSAEKAADTMTDNLQGDMANMNSAFEEMQLQVFEGLEGMLRDGAQYLTSTVIPILTEWVPQAISTVGEVIGKIGNALKPVFESILKNPKAVGTALTALGSGLLVFKTMSAVPGIITNIGSAITKLGAALMANPYAAAAAAIVAAIILIKNAIEDYNNLQIENSLESRFGDIELSEPDIQELASRIIGVEWVANINLALGEFENAEEFHEEAEQALQENEKILWIASVETQLKRAEEEDPTETLIASLQELLDGKTDSNGLEFTANVPTTIEPGTQEQDLAEQLVDLINAAITGASAEELDEYAAKVATSIDPDGDQATLTADLVDWANAVVSGASGEELDDYTGTVTVDLTPEESDTFYGALQRVVTGMTETKLEESPIWKDTLSIELTPEMAEDFKSNIEEFLNAKTEELSSLTFAAKTSMETVLGDKAGEAMIAQMQTWAAQDTAELDGLSESLTALVEQALEDGVLDVEEQAAIDILQQKINNILSGWKQSQAEAEWQLLETKWSGADLTSGSFMQLVEEMHTQRTSAMEALDADTLEMYSVFNGWQNSGKITADQNTQLHDLWNQNYLNMEAEALARGVTFATNTLSDTYGDVVKDNLTRLDEGAGEAIALWSEYAGKTGIDEAYDASIRESLMSMDPVTLMGGVTGGADLGALQELYKSMEPDVSDMQTLLDRYRETGTKIPQALTDAFNDAINVGAASGDESAAWQKYANSIVESGNQELINAFADADGVFAQALPELKDALDRALYNAENSVESADLSEFFNKVLGLEDGEAQIDVAKLADLLESVGVDISEYMEANGIDVDASNTKINLKDLNINEVAEYAGLQATGNAIEIDGGEILIEYEVVTGDTMENIAAQVGVTLEELESYNQQIIDEHGSFDLIYPGDLIYVPEVVSDDEGIAEEAGAAADEAAATAQAAADEADSEVETTITQNTTYEAGDVDTSQVGTAAQDAADSEFANTIDTTGTVDVTLDETDNVPEVYSTVDSAITTAFSAGFSASATVNVTLTANYSLANPTATIEFGGGAEGSATVTASLHALGGLFDEAHLGIVAEEGPEYIIPMNGSDESLAMWQDAGSMLGAFDGPIQTSPSGDLQGGNSGGETSGGTRDINLNINGSGSMTVSSNMSKDDVVDIIMENIRDAVIAIIQQEILTEGAGV